MKQTSAQFIVLDANDNIAVACQELAATTVLANAGAEQSSVVLQDTIDIGHKFARRTIEENELIIKYQAPIGRATRAIAAGEYVHTHNMVSDYMPTYEIEEKA